MPRSLPTAAALALIPGLTGCSALTDALKDNIKPPVSSINRVDLVRKPSLDELLNYSCHNYLGGSSSACALAGWNNPPPKRDLQFSFDVVFDLYNPNTAVPIPMVELLLGFTVFRDQNLGAVCVSFCDPDQEDCQSAGANVQGACEIDDNTTEVDEASDLVPTVDDLLDLANDISSGDTEAWQFRMIPKASSDDCRPAGDECVQEEQDGHPMMCCGDECSPMDNDACVLVEQSNGSTCADCDGYTEAHVGFDLNIDTMLGLFENLLTDATQDFLAGRNVSLAIPYTADGSLFFNVPNLGRYALGFGPMQDTWPISGR